MSNAEVHRDLEVSREVIHALDMNAAQVNGNVKLEDVLIVVSLAAHQARIGRALGIDTVRAVSGVDLNEMAELRQRLGELLGQLMGLPG